MEKKELTPELQDIIEMIHRWNATNQNGCFVFNFLAFKKEPITDEDLEEDEEYFDIDEAKSRCGMFGDIDTIRGMLNEMRDIAEEFQDNDGFISV